MKRILLLQQRERLNFIQRARAAVAVLTADTPAQKEEKEGVGLLLGDREKAYRESVEMLEGEKR